MGNEVSDHIPKVAVVVLSWNRCKEVTETINIVKQSDYPNIELIVIDNASTDGTRETIQGMFEEVRVLSLPHNVGISGWDYGIVNTDAEYIVCLDDDSAPDPDAISRMVEIFDRNKKIGVIPFNIYGGAFTTEGWENLNEDELIGYINCGVGLRPSAVVESGLNDTDFFLYSNEWDLAIRMFNNGYEFYFDPAIRVHHRTSPLHRTFKRLRTLTARNETWMVLKYFELSKIPLMIFRVFFWNSMKAKEEGIASIWFSIHGVVKALKGGNLAWKKRQKIKPEIIHKYVRNFLSFRPVSPVIRNSLKRRLNF